MGNKGSKSNETTWGPCGECNCQSEVPRVIAACNKSGENAMSKTLEDTVTSLVGKENSTFIMDEYNKALGTDIDEEWAAYRKKIKYKFEDAFTNYEGFIEGNEECVRCDCVEAANEVIRSCQDSTQQIPGAIASIIAGTNAKDFLSPITDEIEGKPEINNDWKDIFYPNIKIEQINNNPIDLSNNNIKTTTSKNMEGFKNIEGLVNNTGNQGTYAFTSDALNARYNALKDGPSYINDSATNARTAIAYFLIRERTNLNNLYNYYETFCKDYKTLYLQKDAFAKTVKHKLDELKRIQTKIDTYKTNSHIDNRKNLYQSNNYDFYTNIRFYMLIVYYSVIVIYLIFSKFFSEKQYTNKLLVLLIVLYLIMPIILEHLINLVYEGYIYFLEINNLKEDAKSYEDIINSK